MTLNVNSFSRVTDLFSASISINLVVFNFIYSLLTFIATQPKSLFDPRDRRSEVSSGRKKKPLVPRVSLSRSPVLFFSFVLR